MRSARSGLSIFKLTGFKGGAWTHSVGKNLAQLALWTGQEVTRHLFWTLERHGKP